MSSSIEVIIFDLGGVLVELGESPVPSEWLPEATKFCLEDWFLSETAISFEKGLVCKEIFVESFKKELKINASSEKIIEYFTQWPKGTFPGVQQLLETLSSHYKLALLSNTNELHWPRILGEFNISGYFTYMFASHLLEMAKPELTIFQHVLNELDVDASKILFLDDNIKNIHAAEKLGIESMHVKGIEQTRQCLIEKKIMGV